MNRILSIILIVVGVGCVPKKKPSEEVIKPEIKIEVTAPLEKEVVTFVYHRFGDNRFPSTNISTEDFEAHLKWLSIHNFQVLSLSDALAYLKNDSPIQNTAVITIDDGYKSFYTNALPLLLNYKFPTTLFINTETVGAGDYMDWQQLEQAMKNNVEIGNHTHSHAYFLNQKQNERYTALVNEIELSQKIISENLGMKPNVFAYPYGEFDDGIELIVKALGFAGAVAQNSGVINNTTNLFQLPRFPMSESYAKKFEEKAMMRSLSVIRKNPAFPIIPKGKPNPTLTLTFNASGLVTDQMQCFVQGGECKLKVVNKSPSHLTVALQASQSILKRRRTLYTLTVPDSSGRWHWFSHLWINPSVK